MRSIAGRTTVDPPLIGCVLVLNDGMMVRNWSFRSPAPWLTRSVADSTSTGTADAVALHGCARTDDQGANRVQDSRDTVKCSGAC